MSRFRTTSRGDVINFMGETKEKIIVAPTGIIRHDISFEDQVREYNERKALLAQHRLMIERLRAEREADENLRGGSLSPSRGGRSNSPSAELSSIKQREAATLAARKALEEMKAYAEEIQRQRSPDPKPLQVLNQSLKPVVAEEEGVITHPPPNESDDDDGDGLAKEPSQYNRTLNESNLKAILSGNEAEPQVEQSHPASPMRPLALPTQEEMDAAPPQISPETARLPSSQAPPSPRTKGREFLHAVIMAHLTVRGLI